MGTPRSCMTQLPCVHNAMHHDHSPAKGANARLTVRLGAQLLPDKVFYSTQVLKSVVSFCFFFFLFLGGWIVFIAHLNSVIKHALMPYRLKSC